MRFPVGLYFLIGVIIGEYAWDASVAKYSAQNFMLHVSSTPRRHAVMNNNAVLMVIDMANSIGEDLYKNDGNFNENITMKFKLMVKLIRTMDTEQILEAGDVLYHSQVQESEPNASTYAWTSYVDAVSEAGTDSAFAAIIEWIELGWIN